MPHRLIALCLAIAVAILAAFPAPPPAASAATAPFPAKRKAPALVGYNAAPGSRDWPIDAQLSRFSPAADSAWRRSKPAGHAFGDSLLRIARARGDRTLEAAVHVWRGRKYANDYLLPRGEADLDTAWALSVALRDSAGLTRVVIARGHGNQVLGQLEESRRLFVRAAALAQASGLPGLVGFANRGMGFVAKEAGRFDDARRHLRTAIRLIPPERFENRHSRFLLAEVENRSGHHDAARDSFMAVLDEARRRNDRWLQAAVFNDIGNLEFVGGDMAQADRNWEFAAGVFDSTNNVPSAINSRLNRAYALRHLGRYDEALALLARLLEVNRAASADPVVRNALYAEEANVYRQMGRLAEAERLFRAARATDVGDAQAQEYTALELTALLRESGRAAEALALVDSMLAPGKRATLTRDNLSAALEERSACLRAAGRPREALAQARQAERNARDDRQVSFYALDAAIELARCHRDLGTPDSAVVVLRRAVAGWERWRASISDFEWRERGGSGLAELFADYGLALLDPRRGGSEARRVHEAFDALQTFQARTLEERLEGRGLAGRGMRHRVTADSLRRGVLRDGELLVDVVATPDTTFAFLLTRGGIAVRLLPGAARLSCLYGDWRDATLAGAQDAVVSAGLRRLSDEFVAPLAGPLRASRRVILTGGGPMALWPLAALTVPGEVAALGERREISTAPSATLFAALRGAAPAAARAPRGLLALGRTTDARGRDLPGAERELRELGAGFAAEVRANRGERTVSELVSDLSRWNVLHFAAHAEAVSGSPWRSGFLLGRGSGDDAYLRASTVAGMNLRARLAVLSGCQSAGAATLAGEGALGLASAFLCSGTTSVVATLWPVEDRVAERFMSGFYAALARGATVAGAVADAQRGLRARSETAQVRDWAAFVVSGEGEARVPLRGRLTGASGDRLN